MTARRATRRLTAALAALLLGGAVASMTWPRHVDLRRFDALTSYARPRVQAMVLRDRRGADITDEDWLEIAGLLDESYASLASAVRSPDGRVREPALGLDARP